MKKLVLQVLEESQTRFSSCYRKELPLQRGRGDAGVILDQEAHRKEHIPPPTPGLAMAGPGMQQKRGSPRPAQPPQHMKH